MVEGGERSVVEVVGEMRAEVGLDEGESHYDLLRGGVREELYHIHG